MKKAGVLCVILLCVMSASCSVIPFTKTRSNVISKQLSSEADTGWHPEAPTPAEGVLCFDSQTGLYSTEEDAKKAARHDVALSVSMYCISYITGYEEDKSFWSGSDRGALFDIEIFNTESSIYTEIIISQIEIKDPLTRYFDNQNEKGWKAWTYGQVSKEHALEETQKYIERIEQRYANWMKETDDKTILIDALRTLESIYAALEANRLHRMLAYYDGSGGRVSLYNYCSNQIQNLASGTHFSETPRTSVQKGSLLTTVINISSDRFKSIGSAHCRVRIIDDGKAIAERSYTIGPGNSFSIDIPTRKIGNYHVQLELLLNEISPSLRQNPSGEFPLEVIKTILPVDSYRFYIGGRGGFVMRSYKLAPAFSGTTAEDYDYYFGALQASFYPFNNYDYPKNNFALQAELVYNRDIVKYSGTEKFFGEDSYPYKATFDSTSLLIPVLVKYTFRLPIIRPGLLTFSPLLGIYFTVPLGEKGRTMNYTSESGYNNIDGKFDFSAPLGFIAGGSIGFALDRVMIFTDVRYSLDAPNYYIKISDSHGSLLTYHRTMMAFTIGFDVGLGRRN
jgi:hypothetical protein